MEVFVYEDAKEVEVFVYEDAKEVEATSAPEDDLSAIVLKKKRRVSFAQTQTIHLIPRHDDVETPPLLTSDPLSSSNNALSPSSTSELAIARVSSEHQSASPRVSTAAVHDLPLRENSVDFGHFTSDMDTGHGSWADEDLTACRDSFANMEDDSGCFVHIGHISRIEDDDSIVNDVFNDDMTMDATTFTKNLSQYVKSGTTTDFQGAGLLGQVTKVPNDSGTLSEDDSMVLTKTGAPHWALINPQDVTVHAIDDQSDMSLATGSERVRAKKQENLLTEYKISSLNAMGSVPGGLHSFLDNREIIVDNWQNIRTENAGKEIGLTSNVDRLKLTDNCQSISTEKVDLKPASISDLDRIQLTDSNNFLGKKMTEDAVTSSKVLKQPIAGFRQGYPNAGSFGWKKDAKQHSSVDDEKSVTVSSQRSSIKVKPLSPLSNNSIQSVCQDWETKPELVEVSKPVKGQKLLKNNSLQSVVGEPRSHSKGSGVLDRNVQTLLEVSKNQRKANQIVNNNLVTDKQFHQPLIKVALLEENKKASNNEVPADGDTAGRSANLKVRRSLEDIMQCLKGSSHLMDDQAAEEGMVQIPPIKLQTLSDCLRFSCNMQPQMVWLSELIQRLEVKLQNAKKRNTEIKSSAAFAQKLLEESSHAFKVKLASTYSLAKKGLILWKLDAQRKLLSWLQESKENLINEVEAAKMKGQQILHLKEMYSEIGPEMELGEYSIDLGDTNVNLAAAGETTQFSATHEEEKARVLPEISGLKIWHRHYQESCHELSDLKVKWNEIQVEVQSIASARSQMLKTEKDKDSFENDLKASIRKLVFTNSILQQQQVMNFDAQSLGEKSVLHFSIGKIYLQSFQFEGDDRLAQVQFSRSLHPEAIEMVFPCMEALLFFQYFSRDIHGMSSMKLQQLSGTIQQMSFLWGSFLDVLTEIKFCRRNFGISCKFQILNGKPRLSVRFLQLQSGIRVILMFDMACVRGGEYPFDLKPADMQIETYGSSNNGITCSDILTRIAKIEHGFGRLAKICSCVESAINSLSC